ncbi:MAG: DUF448 domain-containing protein [Magnetococcales bacterium]|nr:DUF448 domain-containing protein [Magnetococcales bacterium]
MKVTRRNRNLKRQEEKNPDKRPDATASRTCLISRTIHPRTQLLRFVVDSQGRLVEDVAGRLPGRGIYIQPTRQNCAGLLKRQGLLKRLSTQPLVLPEVALLQDRVSLALTRRVLDGVGLARRNKRLLLGLQEVEGYLARGGRPLLLVARDASDLTQAAVAHLSARHNVGQPVVLPDRKQLGAALGQETASVLALPEGKMARRMRANTTRWQTFFMS